MSVARTSISNATTYEEIAEFWDTHDTADYWDQSYPVEFEVDLEDERVYYRLELSLSDRLRRLAKRHGVSSETLLNLWVQEKLAQEMEPKRKPQAESTAEPVETEVDPVAENVAA